MITRYLQHIQFDLPWVLPLLLVLPVWLWRVWKKEKQTQAALLHPSTSHLYPMRSWRIRLRFVPMLLRTLAMACLIVALAKPAHYQNMEITEGDGIDIVLCLDVSGSMLARDFTPDRLTASLDVARRFVEQRKGDRIGLAIFSGQSLSLCPLTSDKNAVLQQLQTVEYGQLADGTSLGTGLASAVDRLRMSKTPSKVVILLTDGEDTGGFLDPGTAKQLAQTYGIKVYTIGVGSTGYAEMPYKTPDGSTVLQKEKVNIDEALLTNIANSTGGQYFRATNTQMLDSVYQSIDKLERSKVETRIFTKRTDEFFPWVMAAVLLLCIELLLQTTVFRKLP
jgi:Ca-activated chloride channel family protein